jgi:FMN phosphatase YigB (HAD superfamily)
MEVNKEKLMPVPQVILMDLGQVLIFSTEEGHQGKLNPRHKELLETQGENYNFFNYFGLNEKLLELLAQLKEKYSIYMITEGNIQNHPQLREKLASAFDYDKFVSTGSLGLDKKTPEAYGYVTKMLGVSPKEILFIDDSEANIDAANQQGLQTILFFSEDQVVTQLKNQLGTN